MHLISKGKKESFGLDSKNAESTRKKDDLLFNRSVDQHWQRTWETRRAWAPASAPQQSVLRRAEEKGQASWRQMGLHPHLLSFTTALAEGLRGTWWQRKAVQGGVWDWKTSLFHKKYLGLVLSTFSSSNFYKKPLEQGLEFQCFVFDGNAWHWLFFQQGINSIFFLPVLFPPSLHTVTWKSHACIFLVQNCKPKHTINYHFRHYFAKPKLRTIEP